MIMPLLGAHMSIEGGLHNAFDRIAQAKGKALQIFSKNQRQWRVPELSEAEISDFLAAWQLWGKGPVAVHDSYLINLANPDASKAIRAVEAFTDEITRAKRLHIPFLIMHPGSHVGCGINTGLEHLARNLDRAFRQTKEAHSVMVLLETTAGQGTGIGASFEEIAYVLAHSQFPERLGVCMDTCHVFAAGYDIRTKAGYDKTFTAFDKSIGLARKFHQHADLVQ
jgi:deoxyribonuclease-4